jgi:hypothetical protein
MVALMFCFPPYVLNLIIIIYLINQIMDGDTFLDNNNFIQPRGIEFIQKENGEVFINSHFISKLTFWYWLGMVCTHRNSLAIIAIFLAIFFSILCFDMTEDIKIALFSIYFIIVGIMIFKNYKKSFVISDSTFVINPRQIYIHVKNKTGRGGEALNLFSAKYKILLLDVKEIYVKFEELKNQESYFLLEILTIHNELIKPLLKIKKIEEAFFIKQELKKYIKVQ